MNRLIIDVGMFDAADTDYYLSQGFNVVAIEADPLRCEQVKQARPDQLASGRLTVLNLGIDSTPGELPFYRNLAMPRSSSFLKVWGDSADQVETLIVPCVTLASVLEQHGVPYFLKVDIEGMDEAAISTLTPAIAPQYISVELGSSRGLIEKLHALGYRRFKIINQATHTQSSEIYDADIAWRALRKLSRKIKPLADILRRLPRALRPPRIEWESPLERNGQQFRAGMSGPFAEQSSGPWRSYDEILHRHRKACDHAAKYGSSLWLDVHAKLGSR